MLPTSKLIKIGRRLNDVKDAGGLYGIPFPYYYALGEIYGKELSLV